MTDDKERAAQIRLLVDCLNAAVAAARKAGMTLDLRHDQEDDDVGFPIVVRLIERRVKY